MSGAAVSNIVLGIVVVGWLISRQLRTRPVREDSAVRLVLVLGAIGVVELVESAKNQNVGVTAISLIVLGLVVAAVFAVVRAATVRIWRAEDGSALRKGSARSSGCARRS